MVRKSRVFAMSISALFLAEAAVAAPLCTTSPAAAACNDVLVKNLYVTPSGATYVGVDANISTLNCSTIGGVYLTLEHIPGSEKLYSLLLTAHQLQHRLYIRLNDGSSGCTIAYALSVK